MDALTAILGVVDNGRAWIAGDSRASRPSSFWDGCQKVAVHHGWVWGISGSLQILPWLELHSRPMADGESDLAYLSQLTGEAAAWCRSRGRPDDDTSWTAIVGRKGKLWFLDCVGGVLPVERMISIGDETAPSAAYLCTDPFMPVPERMVKALEALATVTQWVGGPIDVLEAV